MIKVALISLSVVLYGQLFINAAGYYFDISHPSRYVWSLLYFFTVWFVFKSISQNRVLVYDFYFFIFAAYVYLNFLVLGKSNILVFSSRILLICILPYVCGRVLGKYVNIFLFSTLKNIVIFYLMLIFVELIKEPSLFFVRDRLTLFSSGTDMGFGVAYFIGITLGSMWVAVISHSLMYKGEVNKTIKIDKISLVGLFVIPIVILAVGSRSSFVVMMASVLILMFFIFIFFPREGGSVWWKVLGFVLPVLITVLIVYDFLPESRKLLLSQLILLEGYEYGEQCALVGTSLAARITLINESLRIFSEFPLFGVGASNFGFYYCGEEGELLSPHSVILQIIAEFGLLGISLFLFIIIVIINKVAHLVRSDRYGNQETTWLVFSLWLFMLIQMQITGNIYYDFQFYLLTGLLVSCFRHNKPPVVRNSSALSY